MLFRSIQGEEVVYYRVRLVDGLYRCDCWEFKLKKWCRHIEQVAEQGLYIEEETGPALPSMKEMIEQQMDYVYKRLQESKDWGRPGAWTCPMGRLKSLEGRCMCGGKDMVWDGQVYICDACGEEMCCLSSNPEPVVKQIVMNCLAPNRPMPERLNQYITLAQIGDSVPSDLPCRKSSMIDELQKDCVNGVTSHEATAHSSACA